MKSAAKIILLFLLLVLIVSGLSVYWTFFKLVPSSKRTVELQGLISEVTIRWDDNMVPHIAAENETDALTVTGYLHARDRLWQMTRYQYKLEGLHSREIDESLLELDVFYLTMPFADNARQAYEMLSDQDQQLLEAYASGINQYIDNNRRHLPIEFTLSDARPVTWKPWHTLGVQLLWGWQHHHAFWSKLALTPIHELGDSTAIHALTGSDDPHTTLFGSLAPAINPAFHDNLVRNFLTFTDHVYPDRTIQSGTGFAVSTRSPQALSVISMTRELPLTLPDQGYEMSLQVGGNRRIGITIPGFPVMLYGQNEKVAWAIQPVAVDDGDFFTGRLFASPMTEPVDWKRDASVYDNLWDDITLSRHILEMKNGAEFQVVTRKAGGRPVIAVSETDNTFLAFDWAGFYPPNDFGSYLELALAHSVSDLEHAVRGIRTPAIQLLATSLDGESGRWFGGQTLSRIHPLKIRDHNDETVRIDLSDLLPHHVESDGRPVFFLEEQPDTVPYDHYISLFFSPWDRSLRFLQLMESTSPDDFPSDLAEQWDNDTYSNYAASLTPEIIRTLKDEMEASDALIGVTLPYLQNWSFEYQSNETAATIFELFLVKASSHLYKAFIGEKYLQILFSTPQIPLAAVTRLIHNPDYWPDSHPFTRSEWIAQSMRDATSELIAHYGDEPHDWQWGSVVQNRFESPFFAPTIEDSKSASLADRNLYQPGEFRISGASHTIHSGHFSFRQPFKLTSATTLKRTMFLAPEQITHTVLSTGQSGNIFSDHFVDQFFFWKYGNKKMRSFNVSSDLNASYNQRFIPVTP